MSTIKKMFSDDNSVSSKRILGAMGFIFSMILLVVSLCTEDFGTNQTDVLMALIYTSGGLLGIGTIASLKNGSKT